MKQSIGERVRLLRKSLGFNQSEFSEKLGLKVALISAVELGNRVLVEQNIKMICMIYNVNDEWLRYGTGDMFISGVSYSAKMLSETFKKLSPRMQSHILKMAEDLLESEESELQIASNPAPGKPVHEEIIDKKNAGSDIVLEPKPQPGKADAGYVEKNVAG